MNEQPQAEHAWLQKLLGEWTWEHEAAESGQPAQTVRWTDRVRSLGGLWIVAEGTGPMPDGGTGTTIMTLGYDPLRRRYVGTFIGSMMTHLWVYDGQLADDGSRLVLDAEGPDFSTPGSTKKYRDVIEFEDDDHRTLRSFVLQDDGSWQEFMTARYERVKEMAGTS